LKTRPVLGFIAPNVEVKGWMALEIKQEVVNLGLGFVTVDKATFQWGPSIEETKAHLSSSVTILPVHLEPGQKMEIVFRLTEHALKPLEKGPFTDASELIDGMLIYEYHGLDDVIITSSSKPPLPKLRGS
jgi:hypothetical protein